MTETTPLHADLPEIPGLCITSGPIADHQGPLRPEEEALIEAAVSQRRAQFVAGRSLARAAMEALGLAAGPVLSGARREPLWPPGVLGSISHTVDLAAAVIGNAAQFGGLGIDIEAVERVTAKVHGKVFTEKERASFVSADSRLPGLAFSAKEAGYKATFPLVGRYIGFQEAEVQIDEAAGQFRLRYVGDHAPNKIMEQARGYFVFRERYVLSLVIIPGH